MINERIVIEEKTKDYNEAWIETYFWQESEELYPGQKRPAIVICPGGAYGMTSDREAEAIAVRFMGMGYHAVVLRYEKTVKCGILKKIRSLCPAFPREAIWLLPWECSGIQRNLQGSREWIIR